ncbi:Putative oxidoreductase [hydrothermal vent metagenome]|uniref:Oxidoreductase n=1 Tax=hydrothermal vent metagenome TaxID=652676 RepID=A0A3B0VTV5_9ZZZZ
MSSNKLDHKPNTKHSETLSGWGRYPLQQSQQYHATHRQSVSDFIVKTPNELIARGLGRSYGDSALANTTLNTQALKHFLNFEQETGIVHCSAGVSLAEILNVFVPKGWFLPVTPGTQFVTIGGAIASDVHGKNHHLDGCFSQHLINITLCMATGECITCSPNTHRELFLATCGGMGLTGIIVSATLQLIPIESAFIEETTWKTNTLAETLEQFETHHQSTYSVAWIDCLTKGKHLGRSLLMLGEHAEQQNNEHNFKISPPSKLAVPFTMPNSLLNALTVKAFNTLYYHKVRQKKSQRLAHYAPFFYPLDSIHNWNRLYGKNGFTQYQFVLPKDAGLEGLTKILTEIVDSKRGSFLAVLKVFGKQNANYLSFPIEGYTLAIDFKIDPTLFAFLDKLDQIVLDYGGRLYLTKDARMSEQTFKKSYPQWEQFQQIRHQYNAQDTFNSVQSKRLGL